MARRNTRKMRCDECREETWVHSTEFLKSTRPRCPACGSLSLTLVSKDAKEALRRGNEMHSRWEYSGSADESGKRRTGKYE